MSYFHKIFFVVIVILSVAVGTNFNGAKNTNVKRVASVLISAADAAPAAENSQHSGTAQPATSNDSTTANDIKVDEQSGVSTQSQNDNSKTVMDKGVLLKQDLSSKIDAFRRIGSTQLTASDSASFDNAQDKQTPEIQAGAAMIADLKTGRTYFQSNQNLRWPTASLTKLMTAVMVLKNMDLKQAIKIGDGPDSTYFGNDVLNTILIASKDEAAEAFANAYGRDNFVTGLNSLAKEFGMNSTNFSDPTGMSVANQSTISDLQRLALNIYQNYPKIFEITKKKSVTITELNSKKKTKISNINTFAGTSGFMGGAAGYSDDANSNLLSVFSYANRPILVIILGADDNFGETEKLINWFKNNYK